MRQLQTVMFFSAAADPVLDAVPADRRQRPGMADLEIIQREPGAGGEFRATGPRSFEIVARTQAPGSFLHGAV